MARNQAIERFLGSSLISTNGMSQKVLPRLVGQSRGISTFLQPKKFSGSVPARRRNKKTQFSADSQTPGESVEYYVQRLAELEQRLQEKDAVLHNLLLERETSRGLDKSTSTKSGVFTIVNQAGLTLIPSNPNPNNSGGELTPSSNVGDHQEPWQAL